jgi:hypothetical protein
MSDDSPGMEIAYSMFPRCPLCGKSILLAVGYLSYMRRGNEVIYTLPFKVAAHDCTQEEPDV